MGGLFSNFEPVQTATVPSAQDLVKRNDKLDRDQAAKEQEMTKALEGQKKLKKPRRRSRQQQTCGKRPARAGRGAGA